MGGTIEPHSCYDLEITFKPLRELQYNFNITFHVKNKPLSQMLNVKGEGFMIHPEIEFIDDKTILNLQPKRLTPINFGNIHIKQSKIKKFIIYNKSNKYPFEFNWKFLWPRIGPLQSSSKSCSNPQTQRSYKSNAGNGMSKPSSPRTLTLNKKKYHNELLRRSLTISPGQGTIAPQHEI